METKKQHTVRHRDECLLAPGRGAADDPPVDGRAGKFFDIRAALRGFVLAPFRVHHYRDVHSRMLRDALCSMDCRQAGGSKKRHG